MEMRKPVDGTDSKIRSLVASLGICSVVCGCATIPEFERDAGQADESIAPTVSELVVHIQCEIKKLLEDRKSPELAALRNYVYVVNANLTLDVVDNQGFTPSLSFIKPLTAATNRTLAVSGQITSQQHRNINLAFTLDLVPGNVHPGKAGECDKPATGTNGLKGDLGIREIVISGLKYGLSSDFVFPVAGAETPQGKLLKSPSTSPVFGSTIEFTIIRGIGGGPTLTLTQFKGPGASANLLNYTRTAKDTLVLSFASTGLTRPPVVEGITPAYKLRPTTEGSADVEHAAKAAQDNTTRMILQRLLLP